MTLSCEETVPAPDTSLITGIIENCSINSISHLSDVTTNTCPLTILRTYEIIDMCNNQSQATQEINFIDNEGPQLTSVFEPIVNVSCNNIPEVPILDFVDNCSINISINYSESDDFVSTNSDYTITRTWLVSDNCGNTNTYNQIINVENQFCFISSCNSCGLTDDTIPPTASNPPNLVLSCIEDIPSPDISIITDAADNCTTPTVTFISESISISCLDVIERIYRVEDECGNFIDTTHIIEIIDTVAPTATNPSDITVSCITDIPSPNTSVITDANDNCNIVSIDFINDTVLGGCSDYLTRTYRITDQCGNFTDVTQNIVIDDSTSPSSNPLSQIEVDCFNDIPSPNINLITGITDNCGTPVVSFIGDSMYNGGCSETLTRTYRIIDDCGNYTDVTQDIIINDTIAPTADNLSDITVECFTDVPSFNLSIITNVQDNCSSPSISFIGDSSYNGTCSESIVRTYRITDDCGNFTDITQNIIIEDTTSPNADSLSDITVECFSDIPDYDLNLVTNALDNCSTPSISFIGDSSYNGTCSETIVRTYRVTDNCGNYTDITQNIIIEDTILPTADSLSDITVECYSDIPDYDLNLVTNAQDNCSTPSISFIEDSTYYGNCSETIVRTYRVTDDCGNYTDITQNISIIDTTPPTVDNLSDITLECIADIPETTDFTNITAYDNCNSTPTISFIRDSYSSGICPQTITRTFRVTDNCNNSTDVNQQIIINDTEPPTASTPNTTVIDCINNIPAIDTNIITNVIDNCSTPNVSFISEEIISDNCSATVTRTYRVTDDCDNFIEVNHVIIANDNEPPVLNNNITENINIFCEDIPLAPEITVNDNCSLTSDITINYEEESSEINETLTSITRNWTVTDTCNNSNFVSQTINHYKENGTNTIDLTFCTNESPLDLESLIENTNNDIGEWQGDSIEYLTGRIFDPNTTPIGLHSFTHTYIGNDCTFTTIINIDLHNNCLTIPCIESLNDVSITKILTPNNDKKNEVFSVEYELNPNSNQPCNLQIELTIFNRWGTIVYYNSDYDNQWKGDAPSDAIGKAEKLPSGTYFYIIDIKNSGLNPIQEYIYLGSN